MTHARMNFHQTLNIFQLVLHQRCFFLTEANAAMLQNSAPLHPIIGFAFMCVQLLGWAEIRFLIPGICHCLYSVIMGWLVFDITLVSKEEIHMCIQNAVAATFVRPKILLVIRRETPCTLQSTICYVDDDPGACLYCCLVF